MGTLDGEKGENLPEEPKIKAVWAGKGLKRILTFLCICA